MTYICIFHHFFLKQILSFYSERGLPFYLYMPEVEYILSCKPHTLCARLIFLFHRLLYNDKLLWPFYCHTLLKSAGIHLH